MSGHSPSPSPVNASKDARVPCSNAVYRARLHSEDEGSDPATLPAAAINAARRRHFQLLLHGEGSGSSAHSSGMVTPVGTLSSRARSPSRRSPSRRSARSPSRQDAPPAAHGHVVHVEPVQPVQLPVPGLGPNRLHAAHHSCGGSPLGPPVELQHAPLQGGEGGGGRGDCVQCGTSSHSPGVACVGGGGGGGGHHLPVAVLRARLQNLDLDPQTDPFRDRSSPRHGALGGLTGSGSGSGRVTPTLGAGSAERAPPPALPRRFLLAARVMHAAPSPASGRSSPAGSPVCDSSGGGGVGGGVGVGSFLVSAPSSTASSPVTAGSTAHPLGTVVETPQTGAEDDAEGGPEGGS